jgi:undecaprenyl diphosphate synthase
MTQSAPPFPGLHVAIIPDGNGRWALARGKPRAEGHRAGMEAVRRMTRAAPDLGIGTLTVFAFSGDNWQRPRREVESIFAILRDYFRIEIQAWQQQGVRVEVMGRRDCLRPGLRSAIAEAEEATAAGNRLLLRIAVDYGGREAIFRAACRFYTALEVSKEEFGRTLAKVSHCSESPDVDLLIRTGGEQRLSDFLLWELAYAELYFSRKWWPDFSAADLAEALEEYCARVRTFGALRAAVAG